MAAPLEMQKATITSGKNGVLDKALKQLGWKPSDLARRSKISINVIKGIIHLEKIPTEQEANAIQRALGKGGQYIDVLELWSVTFAMPKCRQMKRPCLETCFESLWDHAEAMQLSAPERENEGMEEAVEMVLSKLPKRTYEILKRRFWIGESRYHIGDVLGVTHQRVRQIESRAFERLKHPAWTQKLGAYMPRHLKSKLSSSVTTEAFIIKL
jgi:RNA polymerase sigma factor (sigma-70 family)